MCWLDFGVKRSKVTVTADGDQENGVKYFRNYLRFELISPKSGHMCTWAMEIERLGYRVERSKVKVPAGGGKTVDDSPSNLSSFLIISINRTV